MGTKLISSSLHHTDIYSIKEADWSAKADNHLQKRLYDYYEGYIPLTSYPIESGDELWGRFEEYPPIPSDSSFIKLNKMVINERPCYSDCYHYYPLGSDLSGYVKNDFFNADDFDMKGKYHSPSIPYGRYRVDEDFPVQKNYVRRPGFTWEGMFSSRGDRRINFMPSWNSSSWHNISTSESEFNFRTVLNTIDGAKISYSLGNPYFESDSFNVSTAGYYCVSCYVKSDAPSGSTSIVFPSINGNGAELKSRIYPESEASLSGDILVIPSHYIGIAAVYYLDSGTYTVKTSIDNGSLRVCGWMLTNTSYPMDYDLRDISLTEDNLNGEIRPIVIFDNIPNDHWTIQYKRFIFNKWFEGQNCEYFDSIMGLNIGYVDNHISINGSLSDIPGNYIIDDFYNHQELVTVSYKNGIVSIKVVSDNGAYYSSSFEYTFPNNWLNGLKVTSISDSSYRPRVLLGGTFDTTNGFTLYPGKYRDLMTFNNDPDTRDTKWDNVLFSLRDETYNLDNNSYIKYEGFKDSIVDGEYKVIVDSSVLEDVKTLAFTAPYIREV